MEGTGHVTTSCVGSSYRSTRARNFSVFGRDRGSEGRESMTEDVGQAEGIMAQAMPRPSRGSRVSGGALQRIAGICRQSDEDDGLAQIAKPTSPSFLWSRVPWAGGAFTASNHLPTHLDYFISAQKLPKLRGMIEFVDRCQIKGEFFYFRAF